MSKASKFGKEILAKGNASMVCLVMEEGLRVEGIETFQAFSGKLNFDDL